MRILLTGASSFTGMWFAGALAAAGHEVVTVFRREPGDYEGIRGRRTAIVCSQTDARHGVSFGDDAFLALLADSEPFDVLCHHAAEVRDYHSPDFDVVEALRSNTHRLADALAILKARGGVAVVVTSTFFGQDEGAVGEVPVRAFNPYGLSKSLTATMVAWYAARAGLSCGRFVIPHPFGPFEEARAFTTYLVRSWLDGEVPRVGTPDYVRDNIHVRPLASAYATFVATLATTGDERRLNPSGYVGGQGAFARRFADEMAPRLGVACPLELADQQAFEQPRVRLNTDRIELLVEGWDERAAWDELAAHHLEARSARES